MKHQRNELLRQAREARGWTQADLAKLLSVSAETVRAWERNYDSPAYRTPYPELRVRLCELLSMTPEQLFPNLSPKQAEQHHEQPAPQQRSRNQIILGQRVRARWIHGVLEQSLYRATFIELGLYEQPDMVKNPWKLMYQETNLPPAQLPLGTRIVQVYDRTSGDLLIVGEPGAGKTTLLLDLARELLDRAEHDGSLPIPVVFNLSSWTVKRQALLGEWLVEELNSKYQIPVNVARKWVAQDQIQLLLDGLDEVDVTYRSECVAVLNRYRDEHGLAPMVVCSRRADYLAQGQRLQVQTAIVVQPLTPEQIQDYFSRFGRTLQTLRQALQDDPILQEMATTPLMLNILALTYSGKSSNETFQGSDSLIGRRSAILQAYIERILRRRGPRAPYTASQTIHYLTWMARQLQQRSQTEFYIERMQPDNLPSAQSRHRYQNLVVRVVFGVYCFVTSALYACFRGDSEPTTPGLFYWLGGGLGNHLLGWMSPGLGWGLQGSASLGIAYTLTTLLVVLLAQLMEPPSLTAVKHGLFSALRNGVMIGVLIAGMSALVFSFSGGLAFGLFRGSGIGIFSGLIVGIISGIRALLQQEQTANQAQFPVEKSSLKWRDHFSSFLALGMCGAVGFVFVFSLQSGAVNVLAISYGIIIFFFYGLAFGVLNAVAIIPGLGVEIKPAEIVSWSGKNAWAMLPVSIKQGFSTVVFFMTSLMIILSGASSIYYGPGYGLRYGLVYGIIIGLIGGVAGILSGVLSSGWSSDISDEHAFVRPNEGIRRSVGNAVVAAGLFGLIGGLASWLVCSFAFGLTAGIARWPILATGFALVVGIIFAMDFALFNGGIASLEHYLLRWMLWRAKSIPWDYVAFLDYAAERILLRKVGAGYIFVHRLLLEHFARLHSNVES